jgi:hypothetical protein
MKIFQRLFLVPYYFFVSHHALHLFCGGGGNVLVLLLITPILVVQAYPFGAGHCSSGTAIANISHGNIGSGSLRNGNYQVRMSSSSNSGDGSSSSTSTFIPGPPTFLSTGTDYTLTLTIRDDSIIASSNHFFRGFLFRLSGKQGENVRDAMTISPDFRLIGKDHTTMCSSIVSGVTHTNAIDKTTVDVLLRFDEPIPRVQLEVTVVQSNNPSGSNLWHYDSYDLVVLQAPPSTNVPTSNPSVEPSSVPSIHPSNAIPSMKPSLESTTSPTTSYPSSSTHFPSWTPSKDPSSLPSMEPSKGLSLLPSLTPSKGPSLLPSLTPSDDARSENPTTSPSMEPTATTTSSTSSTNVSVAAVRRYGVPLSLPVLFCTIHLISDLL